MAYYKYPAYLNPKDHPAFDAIAEPGSLTQNSGIYRCVTCGYECTSIEGAPLPPQYHHQHPADRQGPVRWRLVVCSAHHAH
ncbi:hypothetical protein FXB38_25575 [Bradyrhizobium cytisi]|uniref:Protein L n=1 Tax=Bradyrhizobium cytisi TaxID=515489 RepID=A0A5S4WK15_9BRAD|nr:hypothetical protein FXB38_25575 [Bradyrhizobium cytisi]